MMKHLRLLFALHFLVLCSLMLTSCSNEDNASIEPAGQVLQDGEWTGSGEGRSGSIIAKVTVKNHQVELVTIVSQSESVFAQDAINRIVASALGRKDVMSVEVDGVTGATLTSTGVIDAINMAIYASLGKEADTAKIYEDSTCDIVIVGAGGAGLSAAVAAAETDGSLKIIVLENKVSSAATPTIQLAASMLQRRTCRNRSASRTARTCSMMTSCEAVSRKIFRRWYETSWSMPQSPSHG